VGCNVSSKPLFLLSLLDFFLKIMEQYSINMVKASFKIFSKWKRGAVESGVPVYWLTAAGVLKVIHQLANVR